MTSQDWRGLTAIVTGGASGLGAATAARLAQGGLKVTLFDLNADLGNGHAAAIDGAFCRGDVSDPAPVADEIASAEANFGVSRVLVTCAGIGGAAKTVSRGVAHDPGLFLTPLLDQLPEHVQTALGGQVPFPCRLGDPSEYAEMASHITRNKMLNGEGIRLDGAIRMAPR